MNEPIVFHDELPMKKSWGSTRGPTHIWEDERLPILRAHRGKWVDATATWGILPGGHSTYSKKYRLECASRQVDGAVHFFVRIPPFR